MRQAETKNKRKFGDIRPQPRQRIEPEPESDIMPPSEPVPVITVTTAQANVQRFAANVNFAKPEYRDRAKASARKKMHVAGQLAGFISIALIFSLVLQSAHIFAAGENTKTVVLGTTAQALQRLQEAASLSTEQQFTASAQQFDLAKQNFESAKANISNLGIVLNSMLALTPKGQSAQRLLDAGEALALAGQNFNNFYNTLAKIHYDPAGLEAPDGFARTVDVARAYLQKGNSYLDQANADLQNVDPNVLPADLQGKFSGYRDDLNQAILGLDQVDSLLGLASGFIGNGPKTILVLFENNREMRATGGFIGTYGYFRLNNGKIISQQISSIYDLDGQLKDKIAPPGEFHDLTDRWGLRDSNWFADFKLSAQKAGSFYEKEGMETPDAVIAATPDLIVDLLQITGPIDLPKYGVTLSADNFRDLVQLNTSDLYDKEENAPKQMLADFAPILLQKLMNVPQNHYIDLVSALLENLSQKNILLYDRDPAVEAQFESYNWAGEILPTDRDYLEVVNTNLGGRKTDLSVHQKIDLQSEVQPDGSIVNTLTYTRTHDPSLLAPQDKNIDYVRVLVPQGSKLLSAEGFTPHKFYPSDGSGYGPEAGAPAYTVDPDLAAMDKNAALDVTSGTVVTQESGKTEFGNWIETDPGQTSTVAIKYQLPFNVNASRKYSLLVQKQPGNPAADFSFAFDSAGRHVLWSTPDDLEIAGSTFSSKQSLKSDIFIGAVLQR